eukprot:7884437-Pyramimonas_sp.AAC.1
MFAPSFVNGRRAVYNRLFPPSLTPAPDGGQARAGPEHIVYPSCSTSFPEQCGQTAPATTHTLEQFLVRASPLGGRRAYL